MSAFIVGTRTMHKIVSGILNAVDTFNSVSAQLPNAGTVIGCALYEMNSRAIEARYHEKGAVPDYRFADPHATEVERFKAMQCLLYQCAEGTVPDEPVYKELEAVSRALAGKIVCDLPAYDRAAWD
jgi:hypothetical protein